MKVGTSFVKASICICFATCIGSAYADKYVFYGSDVVTHVLQKLKDIQQEYQNLRGKKNLQHFWNTSPKNDKFSLEDTFPKIDEPSFKDISPEIDELSFEFSKTRITSTEDISQQTDALFPLLGKTPKDNIKKFVAVLMSKDFLHMLLGMDAFKKFINGHNSNGSNGSSAKDKLKEFLKVPKDSQLLEIAFLKLNILENLNGILTVSLWLRHAAVTMGNGETNYALLNFHPVFAYDINRDTVQFAGLKYTPVVNTEYVKDMDSLIDSRSNAQPSVQKGNSMFIE